METDWRQQRQELYDRLECSAQNGLSSDAVLASRELFDVDASGHATPKKFTFQHQDDAVTVVVAEVPRATAQQWGGITREVLRAMEGEDATLTTGLKDVYVSDQDIMHVTLFYTSHPDDLAPRKANERKSDRLSREVALLRELAAEFDPIHMTPVKVVLAASGAIILLLQCVESDELDGDEGGRSGGSVLQARNAGSKMEFGVDLLRQAAQETLPFVSKKSPRAIIHTTLARVLSPDTLDEAALTHVREACQRISQQLASAADNTFVVSKLWYVDESHFIRPAGHTTSISLGCSSS